MPSQVSFGLLGAGLHPCPSFLAHASFLCTHRPEGGEFGLHRGILGFEGANADIVSFVRE
jgi:hypothetical protein